ncbi:hypothetical protein [Piscibacillus salipiscarius]|uniref:hypothetical protein n=1 Tax=Piscibacillus salipiscarius TaxID=299480 RepID=UPI0024363982|nr:hypothetical protein [Piscibacillus salipiscarius]
MNKANLLKEDTMRKNVKYRTVKIKIFPTPNQIENLNHMAKERTKLINELIEEW